MGKQYTAITEFEAGGVKYKPGEEWKGSASDADAQAAAGNVRIAEVADEGTPAPVQEPPPPVPPAPEEDEDGEEDEEDDEDEEPEKPPPKTAAKAKSKPGAKLAAARRRR